MELNSSRLMLRSSKNIKQTSIMSSSSSSRPSSQERQVSFSGPGVATRNAETARPDLCLTFRAHRLQQTWFEVQLHNSNASFVLSPVCRFDDPPCEQRGKKSLQDLLNGCELNPVECLYIALVLASSVYQLHSSPWLDNCWTKEQIIFFSSFDDESNILLDKPFLSGEYFHARPQNGPDSEHSPGDSVVESLGIALLELCFNKCLEDFTEYKEKGETKPSHSFSRGIANSTKLLKKAAHRMGDPFVDTIRWCLAHRQVNPDDDTWRNDLFMNVISPLYFIYYGETGDKHALPGGGNNSNYGDIKDSGVAFIGAPSFGEGNYQFGKAKNLPSICYCC